jgi:exodeoxyribonuclease VII large subunit
VSAVGHEIDFTIADFVADRRAPTPSAAAELISPDATALAHTITTQRRRLYQAVQRRLAAEAQQLARLETRLQRGSPGNRLRQQQQRLDGLDLRLVRSMRARLARGSTSLEALSRQLHAHSPLRQLDFLRQRFRNIPERVHQACRQALQRNADRLAATVRELHAVSPLATMQRGYAVLRRADAGVLSSVTQAAPGDRLQALLADGRLDLTVDATARFDRSLACDPED